LIFALFIDALTWNGLYYVPSDLLFGALNGQVPELYVHCFYCGNHMPGNWPHT